MKRNLVYLLAFLCFALISCKDDDNQYDNRVYPTEPQPPYELVDKKGRLFYDEESKEWRMGFTQDDLDKPLPDRMLGDEEGAHLVIKNCLEEYKKFEGSIVVYSGTLVYQYMERYWSGNMVINTYVYSLELKSVKLTSDVSTRSTNAVHMGCPTPAPEPPMWFFEPQARSASLGNFLVNVFVHVVRSSSGYGFNKNVVSQTVINNLNEYYENTHISFGLVGDEYIDSSDLDDISVNNRELLFNRNSHSDALDIYVLSSGAGFTNDEAAGVAQSIPSTACILNSSYYMSSSLQHEVGHCLGLYHTHHGTVDEGHSGCSELVNGSNSSTCGDYIEDTPADPCLWAGCTYIGTLKDANGDSYRPDPTNLMSYAGKSCREIFTQRQIERMNETIQRTPSIWRITHQPTIVGPSHFCTNGVYSVEGLQENESLSWKVTTFLVTSGMDDQPLSESVNTYSSSTLTLNNYRNGWPQYYYIEAIITHANGGTKTVGFNATSDVPSPYMGTLSWLADDGQYGETTNMNHGDIFYISDHFSLFFVYEDKAGNMSNPYGTDFFNFMAYGVENPNRITFSLQDCMDDINSGSLRINVKNDCGSSSNYFFIPCEMSDVTYSSMYLPENSQIEVRVNQNSIARNSWKRIKAIDIYDCNNMNVYSQNYITGITELRIPITNWEVGEYKVVIFDGDKQHNRKIIKK